ncbi:translocation/assembly module TamB domain-containing protein [Histidinibacterium aquaticum]|uniref:Translocation and assembly module TamB C-terminal domain-containing protein n=1 Tax=Histidinibacterium aquaticum TaxID=2613962 RepID=A0A5J5GJ57_9RHOB|nr:translocation/assembly module TamB domain-containing protein [Histidinibacterium aquaticum]KAA9008080.1 hypothetical protein F3S47_11270 [Histidinibacterium aquaticum]
MRQLFRLFCLLLFLQPAAALAQFGLSQGAGEDDVGYLTRLLQDNLSSAGRDVRIRGFEGALSSEATIESITISDEQGVWLEAEDLRLDWNRSALLRRRVDVEALTAGRISVLRAPEGGPEVDLPEAEASLFSLPELPVSVQIGDFSVDRFELGEFFIGEPVVISMEGQASLADGEGTASIVAERIDGEEGRVELTGEFSNETRVLALDLLVEEGEGGIVASRLGIPGEPSLRLAVEGTGPIDDYTANLTLATAGEERVSGSFELATTRAETEDGSLGAPARQIDVDVQGDVAALLAPEYQGFFGDDVSLVAEVNQRADGSVEVPEFSLQAAQIGIEGNLLLDERGVPVRFSLDGQLGDGEDRLLLPLPGPKTYVDGGEIFLAFDRSEGEEWSGFAMLEGYERPGLLLPSVSIFGDGVIRGGEGLADAVGTADISFTASGIELDDPALGEALGDDITGSAALTFNDPEPVRLESLELSGAGIEASATATLETGEATVISFDASAEAESFGRFSTLAGTDLGGDGAVSISGTVQPLDGIFDIALDAETMDLAIGIDRIDPLLDGEGVVALEASRDLEGTRIERLEVTTPQVEATGSAFITSTVADIDLDARIEELGLISSELSGPGTLTVVADRSEEEVTDFDITLVSQDADLAVTGTTQSEEDGYQTELTLQADVEDLAPYSDLAGRELNGAADLTISGQVSPLDRLFDLAVGGTTQDLALGIERVDPLIGGDGRISFTATRTEATLEVDEFSLTTDQVEATGDVMVGTNTLSADIDARIAEVGLVLDDLSGPATLTGSADRSPDGSIDVDMQLTAPEATAQIDAIVAPPEQGYTTTGTVTADIDSLAPYAELAGRPISGAIELTAEGSVDPTRRFFDLQVSATTQDLETGIERLDPLLDGAGRLTLDAARDDSGITLRDFDLATPQITASGTAELGEETREGRIEARLEDVGLLLDELSGPATLTATADQQADGTADVVAEIRAPQANVQIDADVAPPEQDYETTGTFSVDVASLAPFADIAGRPLSGAVQLTAEGTVQPLTQFFDLTVSGTTQNLETGIERLDPLIDGTGRLSLEAARDEGGITVRDLDLATPQLTASGQVQLGEETREGRIEARVEDAGLLLDGLSGPATLTADADQLADGSVDVVAEITAPSARASLDATVAPPEQDYLTQGSLSATVSSLQPFAPLVGRPVRGSVSLDASGTVAPLSGAFDLAVDARTTDLGIGIDAADRLLRGPGTVSAEVSRGSEGQIVVQSLDLDLPQLTADASLSTSGGSVTADYSARLADIGLFVPDFSGPVTAEGTATAVNGAWRVDTDVSGAGGVEAQIDGTVAGAQGLNLDVTGSAPLGLVNAFISPRRLSGDASFDLSVTQPSLQGVSGTVQISGGRFTDPRLGQAIESIDGGISLSGGQAQVDLSATTPAGGTITAGGPISLSSPFTAGLDIGLNQVVIQDPTLYETVVNGQLSIEGPLAGGAVIAGDLALGRTEIRIPSSLVGGLGEIPEVRHTGTPQDVQLTLNRAGLTLRGTEAEGEGGDSDGGGGGFPLDITISAPSQIFVRGRGLDAELGGQLTLQGTTGDIVPVGSFELQRGRIDVLSQGFQLTEGSARLEGDFTPVLRLVAESTSPDGTQIRIILQGPASDPEVVFESSPDLPEDEVISRLLFGRNVSEITPLQAVQLASAVSTLAGRGGGFIGGIRDRLGVDDLDVTTDEDGNAAVRVGTYISENIYTDVEIDSEGDTRIDLNLDITPNLTATGSVGNDGETSIGIFFERDY